MIERGRQHDPGWQTEETEMQPDPMLREEQHASPAVIGAAALLGLAIVIMVFYGLTHEPPMGTTTASSSPTASMSTSGQAPATDATVPSPAGKSDTAAPGTGSGQSGEAQPSQGQGIPPGGSGESR